MTNTNLKNTDDENSVTENPAADESRGEVGGAIAINQKLTVPGAEWIERLRWDGFTADASHSQILDPLKSKLLSFGGYAVVLPGIEEDLPQIMNRGQIFGAEKIEFRRGTVSRCHENVCRLYRRSKQLRICTGYALSEEGGIWRQHSWGLLPDGTVVETTEPRILYFGFVMDDMEAWRFVYEND